MAKKLIVVYSYGSFGVTRKFLKTYVEESIKNGHDHVVIDLFSLNEVSAIEIFQSNLQDSDELIFFYPVYNYMPPYQVVQLLQATMTVGFAMNYTPTGEKKLPFKGKKFSIFRCLGQNDPIFADNMSQCMQYFGFEANRVVNFVEMRGKDTPEGKVERYIEEIKSWRDL